MIPRVLPGIVCVILVISKKMCHSFNETTVFLHVKPNWHMYCYYKLYNFDENAGGFIG